MFITAPTTVNKVGPEHPEYQANPITPSDATDLGLGPDGGDCRALQVTGAGNITLQLPGGGTAVYTGLAAGQRVVCNPSRVMATGTTATGIFALY